MTCFVDSNYLTFPVNTGADKKKLSIRAADGSVCTLNIRLDENAPDFTAFIDVRRSGRGARDRT